MEQRKIHGIYPLVKTATPSDRHGSHAREAAETTNKQGRRVCTSQAAHTLTGIGTDGNVVTNGAGEVQIAVSAVVGAELRFTNVEICSLLVLVATL